MVTTTNENGDVGRKKASCTSEQQLDSVDCPYFLPMQQAMMHRPSVSPTPVIVLQTSHEQVKCLPHGPVTLEDNSPHADAQIFQNSFEDFSPDDDHSNKENLKRSNRPDEASSPTKVYKSKGRRPTHTAQRHANLLVVLNEYCRVTNNNFKQATNSFTEMHKEL